MTPPYFFITCFSLRKEGYLTLLRASEILEYFLSITNQIQPDAKDSHELMIKLSKDVCFRCLLAARKRSKYDFGSDYLDISLAEDRWVGGWAPCHSGVDEGMAQSIYRAPPEKCSQAFEHAVAYARGESA